MDVYLQSEAWNQSGAGEIRNGRAVMADGYERFYHFADVGHCLRGTMAVCGAVDDALYGADIGDQYITV